MATNLKDLMAVWKDYENENYEKDPEYRKAIDERNEAFNKIILTPMLEAMKAGDKDKAVRIGAIGFGLGAAQVNSTAGMKAALRVASGKTEEE